MPEAYDAFISYSHAADGALAPAVQRGLSRLAKPWYRREALRVFRDDTGLAVTPELWGSIATALDGSGHFVLLASPEAAASEWVNREIEHWKTHKSTSTLLPVLTAGEWVWDERANDLDRDASTAVPAALFGAFTEEPRHLDLRWARNEDHLDLRNGRFRNAVAELAAPLRGVRKEELESEDLRLHRRALRIARAGIASLVVLTVAALIAGGLAIANANRAEERRVQATARQLSAEAVSIEGDSPVEALMLGAAAHELQPGPESGDALLQLVQSRPRLERFLDTTPGATITSTAVSPDGRHVAFVRNRGATSTVAVAPLASRTRHPLHRDVDGLEGISFAGDDRVALIGIRVAVMGLDGQVHDIMAREPRSLWTLSPDGRHAVVVSRGGDVVVLDLRTRRRVATVPPPSVGTAGLVAFDADGTHALVEGRDGWQLVSTERDGDTRAVPSLSAIGLLTPRILPDGALFGAGQLGLAVVRDSADPVVVPLDAGDGAYWFEVSHDGAHAVVRTQRRLFVADLTTGRVVWERPEAALASSAVPVNVGFSASDGTVYDLGPDGLTISSAATGDIRRRAETAYGVFVDPGGRRVVELSAGSGAPLTLIDLETAATMAEREGTVNDIVWSPNGDYLLTLGQDTELWHLSQTLVPAERLTIGNAFTRSAAFAEGHLVTSGSEAVALWRLGSVAPSGEVVRVSSRDIEALDPDGTGGIRVAQDDAGYSIRDLTDAPLAEVSRPGVSLSGVLVLFGGRRALVEYGVPEGDGLDLVDLERGRVVRAGVVCGTTVIDQVTRSSDGSHVLATLDGDPSTRGGERLRSCRTADGRRVAEMAPRAGVTGVAGPSRDGTLAVFPTQGEVVVVDLARRRQVARFGMPGPARWEGLNGRAVFTPDDRRIVAEWYFGAVVHDRATERTRSVRRTHVNTVWLPQQIDVHPSGRVAVIAAAVGTQVGLASELSIVDLDSLQVIGPIQVPSIQFVSGTRTGASGESVELTGLGFTESGGDVVTLRVRLDLSDRELARDVCHLLGHTPTRAEWAERLPATEYVEVCREVET